VDSPARRPAHACALRPERGNRGRAQPREARRRRRGQRPRRRSRRRACSRGERFAVEAAAPSRAPPLAAVTVGCGWCRPHDGPDGGRERILHATAHAGDSRVPPDALGRQAQHNAACASAAATPSSGEGLPHRRLDAIGESAVSAPRAHARPEVALLSPAILSAGRASRNVLELHAPAGQSAAHGARGSSRLNQAERSQGEPRACRRVVAQEQVGGLGRRGE
jgi:hypothetical protein